MLNKDNGHPLNMSAPRRSTLIVGLLLPSGPKLPASKKDLARPARQLENPSTITAEPILDIISSKPRNGGNLAAKDLVYQQGGDILFWHGRKHTHMAVAEIKARKQQSKNPADKKDSAKKLSTRTARINSKRRETTLDT
jgi:hypothetical protein